MHIHTPRYNQLETIYAYYRRNSPPLLNFPRGTSDFIFFDVFRKHGELTNCVYLIFSYYKGERENPSNLYVLYVLAKDFKPVLDRLDDYQIETVFKYIKS